MVEPRQAERPLSPHLQIYKPMLTMAMSITHRITGSALYFGIILLVWWLVSASTSEGYFNMVQNFYGTWIGLLLLFGFTWALVHHTIGGLRHLLWDTGRGFELKLVERMAQLNLAGSIVITLLLWIIGYGIKP